MEELTISFDKMRIVRRWDIFLHLPIKNDQMNSEPEIIKHYDSMNQDAESKTYLRTHARRFAYLLKMVQKVRANFENG